MVSLVQCNSCTKQLKYHKVKSNLITAFRALIMHGVTSDKNLMAVFVHHCLRSNFPILYWVDITDRV